MPLVEQLNALSLVHGGFLSGVRLNGKQPPWSPAQSVRVALGILETLVPGTASWRCVQVGALCLALR